MGYFFSDGDKLNNYMRLIGKDYTKDEISDLVGMCIPFYEIEGFEEEDFDVLDNYFEPISCTGTELSWGKFFCDYYHRF